MIGTAPVVAILCVFHVIAAYVEMLTYSAPPPLGLPHQGVLRGTWSQHQKNGLAAPLPQDRSI